MKYFTIFFFIFLTSCGHECKNFIIKKVHLIPVKLIGIDSVNNSKLPYVLINFDLEFVNCKSIFMGDAIEGGLKGIKYSVTKILILDSNDTDITDKFIGAHFKGDLIRETTDSMNAESFYSNINLQELMTNINHHKRSESGTHLELPRPFIIPNDIKWPLLFKMYFSNSDSLVQKIPYNESNIKTYVIK